MTPANTEASVLKEVIHSTPVPGLHIVANLTSKEHPKLYHHYDFKIFINRLIKVLDLTKVGEVHYNFENGGFTSVICLTESHLSIHTWPEQGYFTFDVFLSNYLKDNREKTHSIYHEVKNFFQAGVIFEQIINR